MMLTMAVALIGFVLTSLVSRRLGKTRGAIIIGLIALLGAPRPIVLRLLDLLPSSESSRVLVRAERAGDRCWVDQMLMTLAASPTSADVDQVSADTLCWMGALYVPLVLARWLSRIAVIAQHRIDDATHAANLRLLGG
jgi:glycoside/pentoside/hexuronide:cation symporter, GPH family